MKRFLAAGLAVFAASLFLVSAPSLGPVGAVTISALVNDDPISSYDVQQRARLMQITGQGGGTQAALDDLIEERLKLQEARRLRISITQEQVDQAFGSIAQNIQLSPNELTQALGQAGVNADTLKSRLRADLAWRDVVRGRLQGTVQVREQDVIAALQTRGGSGDQTVIEYELQQIVFVVPAGSGQAVAQQRQREAAALRGRFVSCEQTIPQLTGMRDVVVRRIGSRRSVDLNEQLRETLSSTAVNKLTSPNATQTGIEMIAVCGRREVRDDRVGRQEMQQEMMSTEMQSGAERLMSELKQMAVIERR